MSDLTDKAMSEEQATLGRRRSDEALLAILDVLPQPVCAVNPSTHKILYSNPALINISRDTVQGPIVPGKLCHEALAGQATPCDTCELKNLTSDSFTCLHEMHSSPLDTILQIFSFTIQWADEPTLFMFMTDLGPHYHLARSLEESKAHLRQLFEHAPSGAVRVSADEIVLDANQAFCDMFGYDRVEIIDQPLNDLVVPEDLMQQAICLSEQAMSSNPVMVEARRKRKNGSQIDVLIQGFPVKHEQKSIGFYATYTDISRRKKLERSLQQQKRELESRTEELRRSNQDLQEFAYVASHDLQEPLRMISSYTQLLEQRYAEKLDADALDFIHYAVDGANRLQKLIQDILAFSRVQSKGADLEPVDLNSCLGRARANLEPAIVEAECVIHNDELPVINGDKQQMVQLFQNLLSNAVKFRGPEPLLVHVASEDTGSTWRIFVRDNGIGFDPSMADRIFVIFQRLHTRKKYPGTGIGLALCKRIVERHGGTMHAESQVGKGASFVFEIPKTQARKEGYYAGTSD